MMLTGITETDYDNMRPHFRQPGLYYSSLRSQQSPTRYILVYQCDPFYSLDNFHRVSGL